MSIGRPVTVVRVRTNLGLVPGVERLGDTLVGMGLADRLHAALGPAVDAPPYSADRSHPSRLLNAEALALVAGRQADVVGAIVDAGDFVLVLGGDDSTLFGNLLALRRRGDRHGLVFLDAHIDFYPPHESPTGEASDSDLFLALGFGPDVVADVEGFRPLVSPHHTVVIGHRDDQEQADRGAALRETAALVFSLADVRTLGADEVARRAVDHLRTAGVTGFLVHVDADALDDEHMPAVDYRVPGGLAGPEFTQLVGALVASDLAVGLDITIYNPTLDPSGDAGRHLADCIVSAFGSKG